MEGISEFEKRAVLELRGQFSRDPIVFDIGSNKGGWADILIKNVSEMHLFEPNSRLLVYTMVKYDYLNNVFYNPNAVSDRNGTTEFTVFYNENNGLSNIIGNKKWDYLPGVKDIVDTIKLDDYWHRDKQIDFVKIDVEGAEFMVLKGAKSLLERKLIKFIQVEYSEHYQVTGTKFQDVINYMKDFGYKCYSYDGKFKEVRNFKEDGRLENFWFMSSFTQDWNAQFKHNTSTLPKMIFALEIGCFEGLTTSYICQNLLQDNGRIICVDPLEDKYTDDADEATNKMFEGQYNRFIRNTAGMPVELIRKKSRDAYPLLKDYRFNFIYIDGDHSEAEVFNDGVKCWEILREVGGYLLFDDYLWSEGTKRGIDRFLETQKGNYQILVKDYQVLIKRLC